MRPGDLRLALALLAACAALWLGDAARCADEPWSEATPLVTSDVPVRDPMLLADSAGTVHLFYLARRSNKLKLSDTLMYMRRDGDRWSQPIVLLSVPEGEPLSSPAIALDALGVLHVAYSGRNGQLLYRRAHLSEMTDPQAWSGPEGLSDEGVFSSELLPVGEHTLHLVYASRGSDVFYRRSDDGGRNWSDRVRVSAVDPQLEATDAARIAIDGRGRLHAVWTQFLLPSGWPPMGGYYSRSLDGGATWSPPRQSSGEGYGAANVIARGEDEVHMVWSSLTTIGDRMHEWSADGGATWTDPRLVTSVRGGWTGEPMVALDSADQLHLVTSMGGPHSIERIFHVVWNGTAWGEAQLASGGTVAEDSVEFPALAISDGNHLHVAYEVDYKQIWYTHRRVGAPLVPPRPVPTRATDLWTRVQDTSLGIRVFAVVLVALAVEALFRSGWRAVRGSRR